MKKKKREVYRVVICGDRNWTDKRTIRHYLKNLSKYEFDVVLIHGGAKGADTIAGRIGRKLGFIVKEYKADWAKYGRAAGPLRNKKMLDENDVFVVLAFHGKISESKGTFDMICKANNRKIPVSIVPPETRLHGAVKEKE